MGCRWIEDSFKMFAPFEGRPWIYAACLNAAETAEDVCECACEECVDHFSGLGLGVVFECVWARALVELRPTSALTDDARDPPPFARRGSRYQCGVLRNGHG